MGRGIWCLEEAAGEGAGPAADGFDGVGAPDGGLYEHDLCFPPPSHCAAASDDRAVRFLLKQLGWPHRALCPTPHRIYCLIAKGHGPIGCVGFGLCKSIGWVWVADVGGFVVRVRRAMCIGAPSSAQGRVLRKLHACRGGRRARWRTKGEEVACWPRSVRGGCEER